jgi:hypothetical protein
LRRDVRSGSQGHHYALSGSECPKTLGLPDGGARPIIVLRLLLHDIVSASTLLPAQRLVPFI